MRKKPPKPPPEAIGGALWIASLNWAPLEARYGQPRVEFPESRRLFVFEATDLKDLPAFYPSRTLVSRVLFASQTGLKSVSAFNPHVEGEGDGRCVMQRIHAKGEREPDDAMWEAAAAGLASSCGARVFAQMPAAFLPLFEEALPMSNWNWSQEARERFAELAGAARAVAQAQELLSQIEPALGAPKSRSQSL